MTLLDDAYLSLFVASLFGAVLFFGFTFRTRIRYPLALVTLHLLTVVITFGLFTALVIQQVHLHGWVQMTFAAKFLVITYVIFAVTLLAGLAFFLRYDARRKRLRMRMVAVHLFMAALTFLSATTLMSLPLYPTPSLPVHGSTWYLIHRHRHTYLHYHAAPVSKHH